MKTYLFVYGTLRRSLSHHNRLTVAAEFISLATMQGKLYLPATYPGAIDSDDNDDRVAGEVYRIINESCLLESLDDYEACSPRYQTPHEYCRVQRPVQLLDGAMLTAWVYLYNWPVTNLPIVPSGDFLHCIQQ
ncbi:hypothetical protein Q7C_1151 [Methylophaga frappieri]|uniref:Gamma-glutamylcyclotransferase AIG2-like domain-containing protein n=1 Tax=Methylophaga frappieri (strain ATCC BAA-2434 / DSM 25690 / JAM7) TaxID=754477 RepID=I1YHB3_METFJ|nr:gamma-glutamylcyclotransferase family protein [Methylophaga frappieri]AFJ02306.1 hypothetical protein Q7C_1151 [Methylophaga frappieri]